METRAGGISRKRKKNKNLRRVVSFHLKATIWLLVPIFILFMSYGVHAAGTTSGTSITNRATVNYSVNEISQDPIESTPDGNTIPGVGNGEDTAFLVDNKVDLTVAEQDGAAVPVTPGGSDFVLTFTVTNTGNTTQDYSLSYSVVATGGLVYHSPPDIDSFDMSSVNIYVDEDGDGEYDSGTDTDTYIDELGSDSSIYVFIVSNDSTLTQNDDGEYASYHLVATTCDGETTGSLGGTTSEDDAEADDPASVQVVFADGAGSDVDDIARDGQNSAQDDYKVESAVLTIQKESTVIRDPLNLDGNPKNIPGAYNRYVITISNAATASKPAILTTITDTLNNNLAIDPDLIVPGTGMPESGPDKGFKIVLIGTSRADTTKYFTTGADVDGVDHDGSTTGGLVTADMSIVLPTETGYQTGELKQGESMALTFNVIIQ